MFISPQLEGAHVQVTILGNTMPMIFNTEGRDVKELSNVGLACVVAFAIDVTLGKQLLLGSTRKIPFFCLNILLVPSNCFTFKSHGMVYKIALAKLQPVAIIKIPARKMFKFVFFHHGVSFVYYVRRSLLPNTHRLFVICNLCIAYRNTETFGRF